jgi:hypothetical protein
LKNKVIRIEPKKNDKGLRKLLNELDIAETINQKQVEQNEKWTPERCYQELKKRWYFHGSSWYMRQALRAERLSDEEMRFGCNGFAGCIRECRFYPEEGRIEEEELQRNIQSLSEFVKFKNKPYSKEEHHQEQQSEEQEEEKKNNEQQSSSPNK